MKPLFVAFGLIALVCLFGPTPADAGVGLPPAAPSCAQPGYAPLPPAAPAYAPVPGCSQPHLQQPSYAPAAPATAKMQYTTPPTTYRTPDKVIPGEEFTVPGQTYEIDVPVPQAAPTYYAAPTMPSYVPVPACAPPAVCAPAYSPGYNLTVDLEPKREVRRPLRNLFTKKTNRPQGHLGQVE